MHTRVDWGDWAWGPGRHPIMGAVNAGLSACSITMVGAWSGWLPAGWPIVAGVVLGLAAAAVGAWQTAPTVAVVYRAGCWIGAGGWSTATLLWSTPWSRWPLTVLVTGTALAAVLGTGLALGERREREQQRRKTVEAQLAAKGREAAKWQTLLRRVTRREVTVAAVDRWQPPTGLTLHVQLPDDGTTVSEIKSAAAAIAAAADLPEGCGVEVLDSPRGRRWAQVRVATKNAMAEDKTIPQDLSPLSINGDLPLGVQADGSHAAVNLRYACGVLVGQVGSGKSNTLNVLVHQLLRCADTVVWAVDLSGGGRMPRPWLAPWRDGRAARPAIDWVANSEDEAIRLCQAAIAIINGRTPAYQGLMEQANEDKLPVSASVPQVVIVVDEFADLPAKVKDLLGTVSNTGRGAGVRIMTCVLRATAMEVPRAMVVQASERIAMRLSDESEAQYLFDRGWNTRLDVGTATVPGTGWVAGAGGGPSLFKAWRITPSRIAEVAVELAARRPALDAVSQQLAGEPYRGRWLRTLPVMFPTTAAPAPATTPTTPTTPSGAPPAATMEVGSSSGGDEMDLDESGRRLEAARDAARRAREAAERGQPQPEPEPDWSVVDGWLAEAAPADPDQPQAHPRVRMRQLVQQHRRDGIGPRQVWQQLKAEGYRTAEQTVILWMRADAAAGVLAQPAGPKTPYVPGPKFEEGS